jgi:hypothetical protein
VRKALVIILSLLGFLAFGQENNVDRIENEVKFIEMDSSLVQTEFDWVELTGIITDGQPSKFCLPGCVSDESIDEAAE